MELNQLIDASVENYLRENDNIDVLIRHIIEEQFDYQMKKFIENEIRVLIKDKADEYIKSEIDKTLSAGVTIGDGWSNSKTVPFDEFVKEEIHKSFKDTWNVRNQMERTIKDKIREEADKFIKNNTAELANIMLKNAVDSMK